MKGRRRIMAVLLAAALLSSVAAGETPTAHDPFLAQLGGQWDLTGTLMGKPVHHRCEGSWALKDSWLCFTLADTQVPSSYQAAVYIGLDPRAHDYIAHWLDQFSAGGAGVVATGHRDGQVRVLVFPYAEGAFRNTFTLAADGSSGTLLLEAHQPDARWSRFADYRLARPGAKPAGGAPR